MVKTQQIAKVGDQPTILAVFAHPDDETFLVGGTLCHYARRGYRVELLCLTQGEQGENALAAQTEPAQLSSVRVNELKQACEVLGVELLPVLNLPDGRLTEVGIESLVEIITEAIRLRRPSAVLTFGPDGLTGHPDHIATYQATTLAFEQAARPRTALYYSGLSQQTVESLSDRMEGQLGEIPLGLRGLPETELHFKVDIHHTACYKWEALQCHRTQAASFAGLTQSDRQLLSQFEYFRLARIAGEAPVSLHRLTDLVASSSPDSVKKASEVAA
jgi:N-acetylglucosamine malate deacetylase 2